MRKKLNLFVEESISKKFKKLCIDKNTSVSKEIEKYMKKKIRGKK